MRFMDKSSRLAVEFILLLSAKSFALFLVYQPSTGWVKKQTPLDILKMMSTNPNHDISLLVLVTKNYKELNMRDV